MMTIFFALNKSIRSNAVNNKAKNGFIEMFTKRAKIPPYKR